MIPCFEKPLIYVQLWCLTMTGPLWPLAMVHGQPWLENIYC